jgi:hypothetical protein
LELLLVADQQMEVGRVRREELSGPRLDFQRLGRQHRLCQDGPGYAEESPRTFPVAGAIPVTNATDGNPACIQIEEIADHSGGDSSSRSHNYNQQLKDPYGTARQT